MARTYLTGLVKLVFTLCKYTTKYGPAIRGALTTPELEILDALIAACNAFMASSIVAVAKAD